MTPIECERYTITVRRWGGVVTPERIPAGLTLVVRDYDTVATGASAFPEEELLEDEFGEKYYQNVWDSTER
jgi:hypothetical protein